MTHKKTNTFLESKWIKQVLFVCFTGLLIFFKFSYHELWKDEWQAWLVARDLGWGDMLGFLYYEGHPALWYSYLKCWSVFSSGLNDAVLIQFSHSIPVILSAYLLIFRFKLPWFWILGILFSYHFFFEYGVVNRGYTFVALLGFWLALLLRNPQKNGVKIAIALFLLCQTEVYGLIIAGAMVLYLFIEQYQKQPSLKMLFNEKWIKQSVIAFIAGLIIFVVTVYPRGQSDDLSRAYLQQPFSSEVIQQAIQGSWTNTYTIGLLPDTNVFGSTALGVLLSIALLGALIFLFWNNKKVLISYLAFYFVFIFFLISIYTGGVRQWGMGFIFFIICLQLYTYQQKQWSVFSLSFVSLLLLSQVVHNGRAVYKDFHSPFSNAKYAGSFIIEKVPEQVPIIGINKFELAPVTGYANRPFYELPDGTPFTYFKWLEKVYIPPEGELKMFADYKKSKGLVVISPQKLDPKRFPKATLWKSFDRYSFKNEAYYIYLYEW